jgi:hypothetical protein
MNKTIMITGATSGFGKATAIKFAENGYNIIITGRRKELLDELEKELHVFGKIKVLSLCFDIRKNEEIESVIGSLSEEWKKRYTYKQCRTCCWTRSYPVREY